jgi:uncharacterized repeat protein (TIGR01451 family)
VVFIHIFSLLTFAMRYITWLIVALCLCSAVSAQQLAPKIVWQKPLGGSGDDRAYGIVETVDHGFLVVGSSRSNNGQVTGHHGTVDSADAWVVKLSAAGNIEWQRSLGGTKVDEFRSVIRTNDDAYLIVGNARSNDGDVSGNHGGMDLWAVKLSRDGQIIWQKCFGGDGEDQAAKVRMASDGNALIIGRTTTNNNGDVTGYHPSASSPARTDIWILKIDPATGNLLSQRAMGGNNDDFGTDIHEAEDGNYVITGVVNSAVSDFGSFSETAPGGKVSKITPSFGIVWVHSWGEYYPAAVLRTPANEYMVAAELTNRTSCISLPTQMAYIQRFTTSGGPTPSTPIANFGTGICGQDAYLNLGADLYSINAANYLVAGSTYGTSVIDGVLAAFNSSSLLWRQFYGGSGIDVFTSVIALNEGEYVAAGYTNSNDGNVSGNHGSYDMWVVKFGKTNTIKGTVFIDNNLNGAKDAGEPFANNIQVQSVKGTATTSSVTVNGLFSNAVDTGTYVTSLASVPPYHTVVPASFNSNFATYDNKDSFSFALQPTPNSRDYRISIIPLMTARPGFTVAYKLVLHNVGTDVLTNREVRFIEDRMNFLDATPPQTSISGDTIKWLISSLSPNDSTSITVRFQLHPPPMLNNGDTLRLKASIDSTGDLVPADNLFILKQLVRGSYDPNDKSENAGNYLTTQEVAVAKALNYTIRFQNTGTDTAFTVVVRDTLDSKLDWSTFEMVAASHVYTLSIKNGHILTWTFNNILLADSNVNEPASHGYIAYRIRPDNTLAPGDIIINRASIYFDFNLPVVTNIVSTSVVNNAALPVRMARFEGVLNSGVVNLTWKTATEQDTKVFEVERSTDGLHYQKIGNVMAANSPVGANYAFKDPLPAAGYNYYRLKIVDEDGRFVYSTIVRINVRAASVLTLTVYPNPSPTGIVSLSVHGTINAIATLDVLDMSGRPVMLRNLGKLVADSYSTTLNLGTLQAGTYMIRWKSGDDVLMSRVIIQ